MASSSEKLESTSTEATPDQKNLTKGMGGSSVGGQRGAYHGDNSTNEHWQRKYNEIKTYHSRQTQSFVTGWVSGASAPPASSANYVQGFDALYSDQFAQKAADQVLSYPINFTVNKFYDRHFAGVNPGDSNEFSTMYAYCRLKHVNAEVSARTYLVSGINQQQLVNQPPVDGLTGEPNINYNYYTNTTSAPFVPQPGQASIIYPTTTMVEVPMDYYVYRDYDNKFVNGNVTTGNIAHDPSVSVSSPQVNVPADRTMFNLRNEDSWLGVMKHNETWNMSREVKQMPGFVLNPKAVAVSGGPESSTEWTGQGPFPNISTLIAACEIPVPNTSASGFGNQVFIEGFNILLVPMNPPISWILASQNPSGDIPNPPAQGYVPIVNIQTHFFVKYEGVWDLWQYLFEPISTYRIQDEVAQMAMNREAFAHNMKNHMQTGRMTTKKNDEKKKTLTF